MANSFQAVEASSYETLEALATKTAIVCGSSGTVGKITVSVEKPSALAFVDGAGIYMTQVFFEDEITSIRLRDIDYLSNYEHLSMLVE